MTDTENRKHYKQMFSAMKIIRTWALLGRTWDDTGKETLFRSIVELCDKNLDPEKEEE